MSVSREWLKWAINSGELGTYTQSINYYDLVDDE